MCMPSGQQVNNSMDRYRSLYPNMEKPVGEAILPPPGAIPWTILVKGAAKGTGRKVLASNIASQVVEKTAINAIAGD